MKKTILTAILFLAVAVTSAAQEGPWFLQHNEYPYKGQVKEVREYHIMMRNDEELQDTDYFCYVYSPEGHLLTEYINDVDILCIKKYHWSDRLDSIVCDGDCYSREYYLYDDKGRLTQVVTTVNDYVDTTTIFYDLRGLPVAARDGNRGNDPWFEWYDDGRIKAMGTKYWTKHYEYNDKGQLVKCYEDDTQVIVYTYNEQGDVVKECVICNKASYCGKGYKQTFSYTYDSHGNWTEEYWGGALKVIRKILYYE